MSSITEDIGSANESELKVISRELRTSGLYDYFESFIEQRKSELEEMK